jgi:hypothetical protein
MRSKNLSELVRAKVIGVLRFPDVLLQEFLFFLFSFCLKNSRSYILNDSQIYDRKQFLRSSYQIFCIE